MVSGSTRTILDLLSRACTVHAEFLDVGNRGGGWCGDLTAPNSRREKDSWLDYVARRIHCSQQEKRTVCCYTSDMRVQPEAILGPPSAPEM